MLLSGRGRPTISCQGGTPDHQRGRRRRPLFFRRLSAAPVLKNAPCGYVLHTGALWLEPRVS